MERKDDCDDEELFEPLPFTWFDALISFIVGFVAVVSYYMVFK